MGVSSVVRTSSEYELAGWEFRIEFDVFAKFRIGCFLTTQKGGTSALVSDLSDEKGRESEPFAARHQSKSVSRRTKVRIPGTTRSKLSKMLTYDLYERMCSIETLQESTKSLLICNPVALFDESRK